jgi:peptidoglycan/xylan/chitin deacetylase (PgdA/CDA1 family)
MADAMVRDLHGYGRRRPLAAWPGAARVAVSFILNYEEGGERNVLDGDAHAENYLVPEVVGLPPIAGRSRIVEDLFEYGSRAGFWRVLRLFEERGLHFTSWAVGLALKRNPDAGRAMAEAGHEVASHSWRWIDYSGMPEDEERDHIRRTVATIRDICGAPPLGWYTGRYSPATDSIHLPPRDAFIGTPTSSPAESYFSTLCHELTHWTSAEPRCNRQLGKRFGDQAYAMEELIAGLGAAFLCADLRIADEPRADHAQYLTSWLAVMKADKRAIFTAAAKASEATAFLAGLQPDQPATLE